jgi:hypothetical protein
VDDSDAKRRRELEEVLELRRSFGTLGRRLVKRERPIRSGVGPSLVELLAQPPKAPDTDAGPGAGRRPEPDLNQRPAPVGDEQAESYEERDLDQELGHDPELDREPEHDQQAQRDHEPEPDRALEPEQDQQPESYEDQEPVQDPEPEQDGQPASHQQEGPVEQPEPEPALHQEPDQRPGPEPVRGADQDPELDEVLDQEVDRVSAAVGRAAPVVDERYRRQAPPAAGRRPLWPWLVALLAVFALGLAVDHAVLAPAPRPAQAASTQPPSVAPTTTPGSAAPARPQSSVPPSCLETAQRGDELIDLLVHKARGIDVTKALAAYTKASQTCRKEASSR